jgi:hypothetical protein
MTSAGLTHPVSTWVALNLGGSLLEDLLDGRPGIRRTTGHKWGAMTGALFATWDTGTDVKESFGFKLLNTANGIWVVRVSTVNDNITLFKVRGQLFDEVIDGGACFDKKYDLARTLEFGNKFFNGVSTLDVSTYMRVSVNKSEGAG